MFDFQCLSLKKHPVVYNRAGRMIFQSCIFAVSPRGYVCPNARRELWGRSRFGPQHKRFPKEDSSVPFCCPPSTPKMHGKCFAFLSKATLDAGKIHLCLLNSGREHMDAGHVPPLVQRGDDDVLPILRCYLLSHLFRFFSPLREFPFDAQLQSVWPCEHQIVSPLALISPRWLALSQAQANAVTRCVSGTSENTPPRCRGPSH